MADDADADAIIVDAHLPPWTRELLGCLTAREREVFVLRETGMTFADVAARLDFSPSRASDLYATAATKLTAAAHRAAMYERHVSTLEPHHRPMICGAEQCQVPDGMLMVLHMPLLSLNLGVRALNCLQQSGVRHVGDLVRKTEGELLKIVNLGRKTLREIKDTLAGFKLHLGMETGSWGPPGLQ